MNLRKKVVTWIVRSSVTLQGLRSFIKLKSQSLIVRESQKQTLSKLLHALSITEYGRFYKLDAITCIEDFQKQVPIVQYDDICFWIKKQFNHGGKIITSNEPALFALTSGTTGQPKTIPVSSISLKWHRNSQILSGYLMLRERPKMLSGDILAIAAGACEYFSPTGIPVSAKSGQMYQNLNSWVKAKFVIPSLVFTVSDYRVKYLLILRLALQNDLITYFQTANPTTIILLSDLLNENWESLIADVAKGGFFLWPQLRGEVRRAVFDLLLPNSQKADWLKTRVEAIKNSNQGQRILLRDVFPDIQAVACWLSAGNRRFIKRLREEFPEGALLRDLGYLASELHGTLPVDGDGTAGVPFLGEVFYEFVPQRDWENGLRNCFLLDELAEGERYYVIVSTFDGLLRYAMNDLVEVSGRFGNVPRLRFIEKGLGFSSLTGEKLSEQQVIMAVSQAERELEVDSSFYVMTADEQRLRYVLYYEPHYSGTGGIKLDLVCDFLIKRVDKLLMSFNIEYHEKRKSGRLGEPELRLLSSNTIDALRREWVQKSKLEPQFKTYGLCSKNEIGSVLDRLTLAVEKRRLN